MKYYVNVIDYYLNLKPIWVYKFAIILLLFFGPQSAYAQVLVNGDFETGDFTGWTYSGNLFVIDVYVISDQWSLDFNGDNLPPNGEISQVVNVNIGEHYELAFKYGYAGNREEQQLDIQVDGAGGIGSLINSSVIITTPYSAPKTFSEIFIADTSTITLRFSDVITNTSFSSDMIIDDITIQSIDVIFNNGFE